MHYGQGPGQASENRLVDLANFLTDPLIWSLFTLHPNDLGASSFRPPEKWIDWWDWAGEYPSPQDASDPLDPWLALVKFYDTCRSGADEVLEPTDASSAIPLSLRSLVREAARLAVPRGAGSMIFPSTGAQYHLRAEGRTSTSINSCGTLAGMSPKKAHEVVEMTDFVGRLLACGSSLSHIRHVVDVGAGQAYLSRMLRDQLGLHVLALDFSDVQTQGAARRDTARTKSGRKSRSNTSSHETSHGSPACKSNHAANERGQGGDEVFQPGRGSLTYVTTKIDADTLRQCTHEWVDGEAFAGAPSGPQRGPHEERPRPVLFVALHACGSLTPDILRAFAAARKREGPAASWTPHAAVVVGCCYNMLRPEDFPLSRALARTEPRLALSPSHLQLAAQVPAQWTRTEETLRAARLALRKVVWRALIQGAISSEHTRGGDDRPEQIGGDSGKEEGPENGGNARSAEDRRRGRLGRLNDAAYADWDTFARRVGAKLGLEEGALRRGDRARERRIEVFHVLRCIVGPVIESVLLLDRAIWMREELEGTGLAVELVNLFDQASGSGRNVALVIRPADGEGRDSHG